MSTLKLRIILLVLAGGLVYHQQVEAQNQVPASVLGTGGAAISNSSHRIAGTLGQPLIGVLSNSSNANNVGFWYLSGDIITGVEQISNTLPTEYRLEQNYPNPFNPSTTIQFALPKRSFITLKLFDMLGREVTTLVDEDMQPGVHKVVFDAGKLPSGVYFYRLQAEEFTQTRKLMLVK